MKPRAIGFSDHQIQDLLRVLRPVPRWQRPRFMACLAIELLAVDRCADALEWRRAITAAWCRSSLGKETEHVTDNADTR
jgi:hypothetical protein